MQKKKRFAILKKNIARENVLSVKNCKKTAIKNTEMRKMMSEHKWKRVMMYGMAVLLLFGLLTIAKQIDVQKQARTEQTFAEKTEQKQLLGQMITTLFQNRQTGGNFTANEGVTLWELFFGMTDTAVIEQIGKNCIVLSKEAVGNGLRIEEDPITASLRFILPECTKYLEEGMWYRVCSGICHSEQPDEIEKKELNARLATKKKAEQEGEDVVDAILQETNIKESGITLTVALDTVYEPFLYEDEWYYYISLKQPRELYDKIVVLDAGHGGYDPGTSSPGYVYREKDTNLAVILYMKELLDTRDDIKAYYTRTTDWKPSLEQRVELANALQSDLFISVHCNYNTNYTSVKGIEVLYNSAQNGMLPLDSKRLAKLCLEKLGEGIGLYQRGLIDRKHNVHIIGHSEVPVALIELGYMSNKTDLAVLVNEDSRRTAAASIIKAVDAAFAEIEQNK